MCGAREIRADSVEEVRGLAGEAGMSLPAQAVAWSLGDPAVTTPIVGASVREQLDNTLTAAEVPLDPDLKQRLDDVTIGYRISDAGR